MGQHTAAERTAGQGVKGRPKIAIGAIGKPACEYVNGASDPTLCIRLHRRERPRQIDAHLLRGEMRPRVGADGFLAAGQPAQDAVVPRH